MYSLYTIFAHYFFKYCKKYCKISSENFIQKIYKFILVRMQNQKFRLCKNCLCYGELLGTKDTIYSKDSILSGFGVCIDGTKDTV